MSVALLLLFAAVIYLAGIDSVPLIDRDEPRYAQTSRQMLESADFVVPMFLDNVRFAKPPLIYWAQAGSMKLFGDTVFAARLPSVLAMLAVTGLLALALPRVVGGRHTRWTIFIFSTSILTLWSAKTCLTDAVLLLWTLAAQFCLYAVWRGRREFWIITLWAVAVALGLLTKGPVILGVQAMTLAVLVLLRFIAKRRPRMSIETVDSESLLVFGFLKTILFTAIVLAIALPWAILVERHSPGFLSSAVSHDIVKRVSEGLENHTGPPGYHLVFTLFMFFPWSLFVVAALWHATRQLDRPAVRFAFAAVVGPWLMFEVVRGKLPHYMLPTYPFLAFLTADVLLRAHRLRVKDFFDLPFALTATAVAGLVVLLGVGVLILPLIAGSGWVILLTAVAAALSIVMLAWFSLKSIWAGEVLAAARTMGAGTAGVIALLCVGIVSREPKLAVSKRIADQLKSRGATGDIRMMEYKEPSLAFYQGGTIREQSDDTILTLSREAEWPDWLVTPRSSFDAAPHDVQARFEPGEPIVGWNIAEGKSVEVLVLRKRPVIRP